MKNQCILTAVLALSFAVGVRLAYANPPDPLKNLTRNLSKNTTKSASKNALKNDLKNTLKDDESRINAIRNNENSSKVNRLPAWEEHVPHSTPDALGGFGMENIFDTDKQHGLSVVQLVRGDARRKEVALTFDDGPHPPFTERLLDLLKQLNLHVTFFVVGHKVDDAPELLLRMIAEGHEVANHTYHHPNLKVLPAGLVENEIRLDNDAIRRACGKMPLYFRPPGGQRNGEVLDIAHRLGMTTILWTDDPADYANPGASVIERKLLNHIRPGATILLHDGIEQSYEMLPDLVARLRQQGYRFVTVSEMLQHLESSRLGHPQQNQSLK